MSIYIFGSVLCIILSIVTSYIFGKLSTKNYGLFSVKKKRNNRSTIYMRIAECPTGDMAAAKLFLGLRKLLRKLHEEGCEYVDFETHMIRIKNEEKLISFLQKENFRCEHLSYRKTLLIHSLPLKLIMLITHKKHVIIHPESAKVTICLK